MKLPCVRVDKKYSTRSLISWYDPKLNPSLKNSSSRLEKCPDSGISVSCTGWKRWMLRNGSFHSVEKPIVQNAKIGRPWWEFIPESAHTVRKQISCRVSIKNLKNLNCFKMLARPILGTGGTRYKQKMYGKRRKKLLISSHLQPCHMKTWLLKKIYTRKWSKIVQQTKIFLGVKIRKKWIQKF